MKWPSWDTQTGGKPDPQRDDPTRQTADTSGRSNAKNRTKKLPDCPVYLSTEKTTQHASLRFGGKVINHLEAAYVESTTLDRIRRAENARKLLEMERIGALEDQLRTMKQEALET